MSEAVPAPVLPRQRQALIGTTLVIAGTAVFYLTLIGLYLNARSASNGQWLGEKTIPLTQSNMGLATLIMGSIAAQWAVWAIKRGVRGQSFLAMGLTTLFGLAYINQTTFLWKQAAILLSENAGPYFYAVSVGHVVLVAVALAFMLATLIRALGGNFGANHADGVSSAAMFWHSVVALYSVLWLGVYILK